MEPFTIIEHTADIGIKANGKALAEAFENAALGMFSILMDVDKVRGEEMREVEVEADDLKGLLFQWLSELLYLNGAYNILFSRFEVLLSEEGRSLKGKAWGEAFDPDRHMYDTEIKAVTYHMMEIEEKETCSVQVLFDI